MLDTGKAWFDARKGSYSQLAIRNQLDRARNCSAASRG